MKFKKFLICISLVLCVSLITNTVAFAVEIQPEAIVDSITIENRSGILLGETIQLTAEIESSGSFLSGVDGVQVILKLFLARKTGKSRALRQEKVPLLPAKQNGVQRKIR